MNGKIQKIPLANGFSHQLKVVKNLRINGRPTNKLIKNVLYIPLGKLNDDLFRVYGWQIIDRELQELYLQKTISIADVDKIKMRFARRFPRPSPIQPIQSNKVDLSRYKNL